LNGCYLTRLVPPSLETTAEYVSGCVGPGSSTHHLHAEWQFAVPGADSGLSLGAFHRFPIRPGDLTIIPPFAVHAEAEIPDPSQHWHMLYVSPRAMARLRRPTAEPADSSVGFTSPVLVDPRLAAQLSELLRLGGSEAIDRPDFAGRVRVWLEQLLQQHPSTLNAATSQSGARLARAFLKNHSGSARHRLRAAGAVCEA
jgi:AraC-like protein